MASPELPQHRPLSILERVGVSRGWRIVAAVLIVVLSPVWLPLFFVGLALTVAGFKVVGQLAEVEAALRAWLPGARPKRPDGSQPPVAPAPRE